MSTLTNAVMPIVAIVIGSLVGWRLSSWLSDWMTTHHK